MSHGAPDYSGMKVDVVLRPEWAAKNGETKTFGSFQADVAFGAGVSVAYIPPAGKTFYLLLAVASSVAVNAADADKDQIIRTEMTFGAVDPIYVGGHGGVVVPFHPPQTAVVGAGVVLGATNYANHNCHISIFGLGYEVDT
jgi:hypothetical protein